MTAKVISEMVYLLLSHPWRIDFSFTMKQSEIHFELFSQHLTVL